MHQEEVQIGPVRGRPGVSTKLPSHARGRPRHRRGACSRWAWACRSSTSEWPLLGAVDPFGDSIVFTIIALVLVVAWLGAAYQRSRADTGLLTRPDRERRGF